MPRLTSLPVLLLSCALPTAMFAVVACGSEPPTAPNNATGGANTGNVGNTGNGGNVATGGTGTGTGGSVTGTGGSSTPGAGGSTTAGTGGSVSLGGSNPGLGGAPGASGTGTSGTATSGAAAGGSAGTATGAGGTAGAVTATGGAGGAPPVTKLCASKTTLTVPLMTNFDSYNGMTAVDMWSFPFNTATPSMPAPDAPYAGAYTYNDGTGTPFIGMLGGANATTYAISISNVMATNWGGAVGFWMGCVNASTFQGLSFYLRGSSPAGRIGVELTMEQTSVPSAPDPNGGGTCAGGLECRNPRAEVPITADWVLTTIPWALFTGGASSATVPVAATGDNVAGLSFSVMMNYAQDPVNTTVYTPVPAPYEISIDDLGFY